MIKKQNDDPRKVCIKCWSKNVKMSYEGLETDEYTCLDCKHKYLVADWRRIAGYSKKEVDEMDINEKNFEKNG